MANPAGELAANDVAHAGQTLLDNKPVQDVGSMSLSTGKNSLPNGGNALPGMRYYEGRDSHGVEDVRDALKILSSANIPACIVDVHALRYYGAGRASWEWDICIPDDRLDEAKMIFEQHDGYEPATPPPQVPKSFRHRHPIYKLKDAGFFFILTPSSRCFIDPSPENCELSMKGIPYPQIVPFARSLLVLQNGANIEDFVDGMNLDQKWAEENIDFDDLQQKGLAFYEAHNPGLEEKDMGQYNENVDYRRLWNAVVDDTDKRIEMMKKGRYKTRWRRIKQDIDPRLRDRQRR